MGGSAEWRERARRHVHPSGAAKVELAESSGGVVRHDTPHILATSLGYSKCVMLLSVLFEQQSSQTLTTIFTTSSVRLSAKSKARLMFSSSK